MSEENKDEFSVVMPEEGATKETLQQKYSADKFDFDERPASQSSLKNILISPLHFAYYRFNKKKPTKQMMFGNAVDSMLFTPEKFKSEYIIKPKFKGTGMKAKTEEWEKENARRKYLSDVEQYIAETIVENIKTNPKTKWLYEATVDAQKKIVWTDPKTGIKCIAYLDAVSEIEREGKKVLIIWDLKTTTDASKQEYPRHAANMDYPLQAGTYVTGLVMDQRIKKREEILYPEFYQIVAETKDAIAVNCFRATNDFVNFGKDQFRKAMDIVKYCKENDLFWMGYEFMDMLGYDELDIPGYMKQKN